MNILKDAINCVDRSMRAMSNRQTAFKALRAGGHVQLFRQLPAQAQQAIYHYMAVDGEAWHADLNQREARLLYGALPFGYVQIPMAKLKAAVMLDTGVRESRFESFDGYHADYVARGRPPRHSRSAPWPVILAELSDTDEPLQDGWHRFHRYVELKLPTVPAVYYVRGSTRLNRR